MKHFALLFSFCCFLIFAEAANVTGKKEQKLQEFTQTLASVKQYMQASPQNHTVAGFQKFMGRKLTSKEKKIFKLYLTTDPQTPEEEADMMRNKKLGMWSMIMGVAGFVLMFVPYANILSIFLFPAALITGIIALGRASKFGNKNESGFGNALAGTIIGGLGILLVALAVFLVALAILSL